MNTTNSQIDRLKQVYNKKTDVSLAEALGVDKNTVSVWKKRKAIPSGVLVEVSMVNQISMDWLLNGDTDSINNVKLTPESSSITLPQDDPIRALCYLEGYIERIMHEQGLQVEQSVRDRFDIVHRNINASVIEIINKPLTDIEINKFIGEYHSYTKI
jgi:hypothetical protein